MWRKNGKKAKFPRGPFFAFNLAIGLATPIVLFFFERGLSAGAIDELFGSKDYAALIVISIIAIGVAWRGSAYAQLIYQGSPPILRGPFEGFSSGFLLFVTFMFQAAFSEAIASGAIFDSIHTWGYRDWIWFSITTAGWGCFAGGIAAGYAALIVAINYVAVHFLIGRSSNASANATAVNEAA